MRKLKYNEYRLNDFFIKTKNLIGGMGYGFINLKPIEIDGIIECIDILAFAYPIPQNLRNRIENQLLPRFYEIQDFLLSENINLKKISIQISKLNKEDIIYGLQSATISKLLKNKGFSSSHLLDILNNTKFEMDYKELKNK